MKHAKPLLPFGTVSVSDQFHGASAPENAQAQAMLPGLLGMLEAFDLDEGIFFLAWELVSMQDALGSEDRRTALMMVLATLISTRQGSTCLPLGLPLRSLLEEMVPEEVAQQLGVSAKEWHDRITALVDASKTPTILGYPGDYKPLILQQRALHHHRMLLYENQLIEAVEIRHQMQQSKLEPKNLEQELKTVTHVSGSIELTTEQQYAVLTALHLPMTLITGGPGTGKTSVVVSLLRMLVRQGVDPTRIALAAPTGRAAYRMAESVNGQLGRLDEPEEKDAMLLEHLPTPQTLHRLLGYSRHANRYHHHEHNPLQADFLIVDEASMIDMFLMNHLLRALPKTTHLVLLGDADQLPSVEAGAVLRDLVAPISNTDTSWQPLAPVTRQHGKAVLAKETVRLTKSHRMSADDPAGRHILQVAGALKNQEIEILIHASRPLLVPKQDLEQWELSGAQWLNIDTQLSDPHHVRERLRPFIEVWFDRHIWTLGGGLEALSQKVWRGFGGERFEDPDTCKELLALFEHVASARLLGITKVWPTGTNALNEMMLETMRRRLTLPRQEAMHPGVLVMMTKNDYGREIFNGDQGILLQVENDGRAVLMVVFERAGEFVAFDIEHLSAHLDVAFAMTVHKSQGSEFDHVAVILPNQKLPLLTREVLYTAMTRSKQSATLVGGVEVLTHGVLHWMPRHSQLGGRMKAQQEKEG